MAKFTKATNDQLIWAILAVRVIEGADRRYTKIRELAESKVSLSEMYDRALETVELDWDSDTVKQDVSSILVLLQTYHSTITFELIDHLLKYDRDTSEVYISKLEFFNSVTGEAGQIPTYRVIDGVGRPIEGAEVPQVIQRCHLEVYRSC